MKKNKKDFHSKLKVWTNNIDVLFEKEADYKQLIIEKYNIYLEKLKMNFKSYAESNEFEIIEKKTFIEARYSALILRLDFVSLYATKYNKVQLTIMDMSRKEYFIVIRPKSSDIYIPSLTKTAQRPKPKILDEVKGFIKQLGDEFIFISEKIDELKKMDFVYCYYSSLNNSPEIKTMKEYQNFLEIIDELL